MLDQGRFSALFPPCFTSTLLLQMLRYSFAALCRLLFALNRKFLQLWIEVAEVTTASGIQNPIFTQQLSRFILYKPPNVTGSSLIALPYAGGSVLTVSGQYFDSLGRTDTQANTGGLKCRLLWCANYLAESTCKYTPFVSGDVINSTTAVCVTGQYFDGDPDCQTLVILYPEVPI